MCLSPQHKGGDKLKEILTSMPDYDTRPFSSSDRLYTHHKHPLYKKLCRLVLSRYSKLTLPLIITTEIYTSP
jgi:adenine/guanine phosphoribosyltransferase-like PRPP-binding protein